MDVHYQIKVLSKEHIYRIILSFTASDITHNLRLPVWIPGSYMLREFSKQLISIKPLNQQHIICQISKNEWELSRLSGGENVLVEYAVYAYEHGIRTAFVDSKRAYFNPSSLCLSIAGYDSYPHYVSFCDLPDGWMVATALAASGNNHFVANDYDELIDCPFELGTFKRFSFTVADIVHHLIISGVIPEFDIKRLIDDIGKICAYQIQLFKARAPYSEYTFILNLGGEICTALEHRNSTLIVAPYYTLPNCARSNDKDYHRLLGIISHEFFHTWNVKRIKPQAFIPYDLYQENYTSLLWWFEGVTSYYDELVLYRTNIITREQYLQQVVNNLNDVYKFAGAKVQSLANSSITSWIKYYRQDENSPNSIVSYYIKGALVAMCLDLLLRRDSGHSLDTVMQYLYQHYGSHPSGVMEDEVPAIIKAATGVNMAEFIASAIDTTDELPFAEIFKAFGLNLVKRTAKNYQENGKYTAKSKDDPLQEKSVAPSIDLGAKLDRDAGGYKIKNIYAGGVLHNAGLASGDIIIAINNIKLTNLEQQLAFYNIGAIVELSVFRQEQLLTIPVQLSTSNTFIYDIYLDSSVLLGKWL